MTDHEESDVNGLLYSLLPKYVEIMQGGMNNNKEIVG